MNTKLALTFFCVYLWMVVVVLATANHVHGKEVYWETTSQGFVRMLSKDNNGGTVISWHDILKEEVSTRSQYDLEQEFLKEGQIVRCVPWLNKKTRYC